MIGCPSDFEANPHTIVQIDIDPSSISKNVTTDIPIVGDVYEVLKEMVGILETTTERLDENELTAWNKRIDGWRAMQCLKYTVNPEGPIRPQAVIERVWQKTKERPFMPPTWASIRCGALNTSSCANRASGLRAAVWARWATDSRQRSARALRIPTRTSCALPATVPFR